MTPLPQRDLLDLTRQRTNLVRERETVVNRLQQVLEWANLKLAAVATDVLGVSARTMLEAIIESYTLLVIGGRWEDQESNDRCDSLIFLASSS